MEQVGEEAAQGLLEAYEEWNDAGKPARHRATETPDRGEASPAVSLSFSSGRNAPLRIPQRSRFAARIRGGFAVAVHTYPASTEAAPRAV